MTQGIRGALQLKDALFKDEKAVQAKEAIDVAKNRAKDQGKAMIGKMGEMGKGMFGKK